MSNGRVDVSLAQETVTLVLEAIGQIEEQLPFLLRLELAEKQRLVKPRPGTAQVIKEVVEAQREAGMAVGENDPMLADLSVYSGLTSIGDQLTRLLRMVEDTRLQAGSETWSQGLIRYGMLRQLERGQPALKTRLDRIQPLITSRSRRSNANANEPVDTDDTPATDSAE